jgi:hypothetical protein
VSEYSGWALCSLTKKCEVLNCMAGTMPPTFGCYRTALARDYTVEEVMGGGGGGLPAC